MDILEIKNVTYNYSNSKEKILSSVNQKFELGQFYAIIGKSGAGEVNITFIISRTRQTAKRSNSIQKWGYREQRL